MQRRLLLGLLAALAYLLAPLVLHAAASPATPRRIALLVGNSDYNANGRFDAAPTAPFVRDLKNPCDDINYVKPRLQSQGFEVHDFCNLDRAAFAGDANAFATEVGDVPDGSVVFVYYSGHGFQYNGRLFSVPVKFRMDADKVGAMDVNAQAAFFMKQANDLTDWIRNLVSSTRVAVVIALDQCRDNPVGERAAYNDAVSIRTSPNTLIQYVTTPGDQAPDNHVYAKLLGDELARGGDIGDAMAHVNSKMWQLFEGNQRETYADMQVGPAFAALRFTPVKAGAAAVAPTAGVAVNRQPQTIQPDVARRIRLDLIWCEGEGEGERYAFALDVARRVKEESAQLKIGRIVVKPLTEEKNDHDGYNVHRNLMRYDVGYPDERALLVRVATAFPEGNFLPQRGVGVNGKPTLYYVSAFVCGRITPRTELAGATP
jgi:hypothetical protein